MNRLPSPGPLPLSATAAILAPTPTLAQDKSPDEIACYGETHLHTSWRSEDKENSSD